MNFTAAALDVEELVTVFAEMGGTELETMKEIWRARHFSFIHEARPKDVTPAFYTQALFSSALSLIVDHAALSWKLGGLYALYTLHGTQQGEIAYKIYLSLGELEAILSLVKEIKRKRLVVALKVVRKMFADNCFLFGSVAANQKRISAALEKLSGQAASRIRQARVRLLNSGPATQHLHGELVKDLRLNDMTRLMEEYEVAKERALSGNLDNGPGGIAPRARVSETTVGVDIIEEARGWDSHKLQLLSQLQGDLSAKDPPVINVTAGNPRRRNSQNPKRRKTIAEYERELEQQKISDDHREMADELDEALEDY